MDPRPELGRLGEDLAADLMERSGYLVLERNFRCKAGEIDLVCTDGEVLVFCEVKTRRTDRWGDPCEAVDYRKQARLRRLAVEWMQERRPGSVQVRFDVVSVIVGDRERRVMHLPDAF
jgi:putative endonuclease